MYQLFAAAILLSGAEGEEPGIQTLNLRSEAFMRKADCKARASAVAQEVTAKAGNKISIESVSCVVSDRLFRPEVKVIIEEGYRLAAINYQGDQTNTFCSDIEKQFSPLTPELPVSLLYYSCFGDAPSFNYRLNYLIAEEAAIYVATHHFANRDDYFGENGYDCDAHKNDLLQIIEDSGLAPFAASCVESSSKLYESATVYYFLPDRRDVYYFLSPTQCSEDLGLYQKLINLGYEPYFENCSLSNDKVSNGTFLLGPTQIGNQRLGYIHKRFSWRDDCRDSERSEVDRLTNEEKTIVYQQCWKPKHYSVYHLDLVYLD